jgi:hypothetical protein
MNPIFGIVCADKWALSTRHWTTRLQTHPLHDKQDIDVRISIVGHRAMLRGHDVHDVQITENVTVFA